MPQVFIQLRQCPGLGHIWDETYEMVSSRKQIQGAPPTTGSGKISLEKSGKICLFDKQSTQKHEKNE